MPPTENSPTAPSASQEVLVAGYLSSGNGLGETGRAVARAFGEAGLKVREYVISQDHAHRLEGQEDAALPGHDHCPLVACMNADNLPRLIRQLGIEETSRRRVIGVWFWETESPPAYADKAYPLVDEIWTASEFTRGAFLRNSPVPVRVFHHPVDVTALESAVVPDAYTWPGKFVYSFTFDYHSGFDRKNPQAVCAAFRTAFPEPGLALPCGRVPMLVIKSVGGNKFRIESEELVRAGGGRPDILFLDAFVSSADRDGLARRADAVVSLHRSEGLGLTLLEAMALGKPCIATGYSGNLAFMNEENSFLVRYHLKAVGPGSIHYPVDDFWAEPDTADAAELILKVAREPEHAMAVGSRAREQVRARHTHAAVGLELARSLAELSASPTRVKDYSSLISTHARAGKVLSDLEAGIKQRRAQSKSSRNGSPNSGTIEDVYSEMLELVKAQRLIRQSIKEKEDQLNQRIAYLEKIIQSLVKQQQDG